MQESSSSSTLESYASHLPWPFMVSSFSALVIKIAVCHPSVDVCSRSLELLASCTYGFLSCYRDHPLLLMQGKQTLRHLRQRQLSLSSRALTVRFVAFNFRVNLDDHLGFTLLNLPGPLFTHFLGGSALAVQPIGKGSSLKKAGDFHVFLARHGYIRLEFSDTS